MCLQITNYNYLKMNWNHFLYVEFPPLLEKLTEGTQPQWGQMTAQHVAEHLAFALSFSNGKRPMQVVGEQTPEKLAYRKQRFFEKYVPMPKGFQLIFKELPRLREADLATAKAQVLAELERLQDYLDEHPDILPIHPYFGALNVAEWEEFQARHVLHHCVQFGLTTAQGY
jgi:oxepin-CoA hydrolase / 3-oxo-5,6-dehydrosuberyl-CoA semialdehyde dehydrogenase